MRHVVYSLTFLLSLCLFSTVRAGEIHFLPEPQQVKLSGEQFDMKRVRLVSSVLIPQLEAWVTEAGGTVDERASSIIEIRLVEKLEGIPLNENEAYRLTVHRNKIRVEAHRTRSLLGITNIESIVAAPERKGLCSGM